MGAINAMEPYQKSFGLSGAGSSTGIVFITYQLGQIAAVRIPLENSMIRIETSPDLNSFLSWV